MPITRTPIVDDDGSGTTGTVINNAWKQELYTQIDAAIPLPTAFVQIAVAATSINHDFNPGIVGDSTIALNGGPATITGFKPAAAPFNGQRLTLTCFTPNTFTFTHEDAGSTLGYRLRLPENGITVGAYWGYAEFTYFTFAGGGFWVMTGHENGHGVAGLLERIDATLPGAPDGGVQP